MTITKLHSNISNQEQPAKRRTYSLYVHNSLNYKTPKNKNINNNDIECLNIKNVSKASKNVIISCIYRPPRGNTHKFFNEMKGHIIKSKFQEKPLFLVGDLNINSLDYSRNTHVCDFFNFVFQNGIFPVINKPTRVTKLSATIIDHIPTNALIDSHIQSGIIKTDISDHFSLIKTNLEQIIINKTIIERDINKDSMK